MNQHLVGFTKIRLGARNHDSCGFWNAGNVHPITSTQPFNQEAEAAFGPEVRRAEIDAEHAKVSWYEQLFQVWEGMLMGTLRDWGNGIIRGIIVIGTSK